MLRYSEIDQIHRSIVHAIPRSPTLAPWFQISQSLKAINMHLQCVVSSPTLGTAKYRITRAVVVTVPKHLTTRTSHTAVAVAALRSAAGTLVGMELSYEHFKLLMGTTSTAQWIGRCVSGRVPEYSFSGKALWFTRSLKTWD